MPDRATIRATVRWNPTYHPEWDATPERYQQAGIVGWGRSRRLGRLPPDQYGLHGYLGVQHADPSRWGQDAPPRTRFFASAFLGQRVIWLRTFATMAETLDALAAYARQVAEAADLTPRPASRAREGGVEKETRR